MPPSPLDDRIVVALPRPSRPQELTLSLDSSYLDAFSSGEHTFISTTVVTIRATYMPSSKGSTRSLSCGCSSASCCSVTTYERDSPSLSHSSPNLSYGGTPSPQLPPLRSHEARSVPSLASGLAPSTPKALPRALTTTLPKLLPSVRLMHANELAKRLSCCPLGHPVGPVPVIIDCRPFTEYNKSHIRGAVHINCSDKMSRRRLQQGKITVLDLLSCREAQDSFKGLFSKDIVVYDDSTMDPHRLSPAQPLHVVLESLRMEGKDPMVLKGGLSCFRMSHENLCEHSLHDGPCASSSGLTGALPHSLPMPSTPDFESAELTPILPSLYLGNEQDAHDLRLLQRLNVGFILNVTTHLPLYHYDTGLFVYKRLPATDSNKQNLRQYFEEAFEFIEEAQQAGMGLLIHCQAGVSRSATIVIAYLMKHTWMTMTDAYKYVKTRRPIISPNLNFMGQLLEFEEDLNNGITPRILAPKLTGVETIV
ncbi:dual specificity protein phosphatase 10 [Eucyclogobius newberryi]|uniref:dual specificity protein phosphatase 10 n=1 Tax=Eucyclogobius newberryi TaxID=166745 RepID=UPI003B5C1E01